MKMISRLLLIGCITFAILIAGLGYKPVSAETGYGWSPDEKVSGYLDDTFTPFLLADQNRTVHAFTSQWVKNEGNRRAIVYRRWSLIGGWTRPVDIVLSPIGGDANFLGTYMDSSNTMHLIFSATDALTRNTFVYYSNASTVNADWAPAWSTPVLVGDGASGLNSAAIAGDHYGNLVIIYSGNRNGNGVYSMYSKDMGKSWTSPQPVFLTYGSGLNAFSVHLSVGPDQKIRAVWNVVTNLGVDEALYFARFDTQNFRWDTPVELDRRIVLPEYFGPSFPVIVNNGREIVIVYNSGNPFTGQTVGAGRPVQRVLVSLDDGLTWNEPLDPFPLHVGRSGEHAVTLDGNGNPHTIFTQRIESLDESGKYSIIGGVWHSVFQNDIWSNPDRFVSTVPAHDVRAVVSQGNVLLAVWRQDPGGGASGIWYSYKVLDEPELPVVPLATASVDFTIGETATPISLPTLLQSEPSPEPGLFEDSLPSNLENNPALPIMIGIIPVVLILIGVVLGYRYLSSRRA